MRLRGTLSQVAISDGRMLLPEQLQKLKTYRWVRDFYKRV